MAEQRDDGKPGNEPGTDIEPKAGGRPAPRLDEEQLRQFQQFQQFQDYLKFTEAQQQGLVPARPTQPVTQHYGGQVPGPPGPPPGELVKASRPRAPRWLRRLGGKLLAWVIVILLICIGATIAYRQIFPSDTGEDTATFVQGGGGKHHTNQVLSTNPWEAVRAIYDTIGKPYPPGTRVEKVCLSMSEQAQAQFARDLGYPDCATAVPALNAKVTDITPYIYAVRPMSSVVPRQNLTIHSCWYNIRGGPLLGSFTLQEVEMGQWLITGHANSPEPCPAPPTGS
ncbi:hypothetical protein P3102_03040 [Amycolatopsis sp. QT-25]|uniref:hypothetical protein n=1 Tax=Amycolatopsis sp. QT-25 TaxID=3034022 RepID=UPI0023ECA09D|nr:hypothetical protein [Amycolatopsis sp. QT-25]WET80242.1 hypothetical protein P3102_03040 [Amycolatopsis sp. QT-25]